MYNYARYEVYYAKILNNVEEEFYPENKEIFSISGVPVQVQEKYPTGTASDMRSEQTSNRDAKTLSGITNFSTKQTQLYKCCMSRYSIHNIHVTFQGTIIKEIILAEQSFRGGLKQILIKALPFIF